MENTYFECLNETYNLFKSQGVSIIGRGYEEVMSSPSLFEGYVTSLTAGASPDSAAQMAQLIANTNAHLLTEGSVAGIAPVSSLSGPVIRKLWPSFAMKAAVRTEVANTPAFMINYTRPYYEDSNGVRHYVPRNGLLTGNAGAYGTSKDLAGNYKTYEATLTSNAADINWDTAGESENVHFLEVSTASKIKRQPLDQDFALNTVTIGGAVVAINKKLGIENVIVADFVVYSTTADSTTTYSAVKTDGATAVSGTVLVRVDLLGGKTNVVLIGSFTGSPTCKVKLTAHRSVEYNEVTTSWSFDIAREDIRIGTGEHMNAPLAVESLTDMKALYQIDGTKEAVDLMTNAMALRVDGMILDFLKENFLSQPGHDEFADYPGAAKYLAVFDVKPAVGFAGGSKAWREEIKPIIDHLAARIKNQTFLGSGMFNIVANPLDAMLITNVDWSFRGGQQTVDGVSVNYSLGTYFGTYTYKIVSSEIVPQGVMYIVFIPEEKTQMTYNYWAYAFSTELGYRDPNRAMVPSILLCKRDVCKSFMPAIAAVKIIGNDAGAAYDPFRDVIPTKEYGGTEFTGNYAHGEINNGEIE